jgi:GxxExxY protein
VGFAIQVPHHLPTGSSDMTQPRSEKGYSFEQLSYEVIGACIDVQRQLGVHCMEVDYQRALALALPKRGLLYQREVEVPIAYDGVIVTRRRVDFVIWNEEGELLLETKAKSEIQAEDVEQCLLYLHQGGYRLCLLVNFGEKPLGVRRFVHTPKAQEG